MKFFNYTKLLSIAALFIFALNVTHSSALEYDIWDKPAVLAEKADSGKTLKRDDIDPKYTWNFKDLYESKDLWEADFEFLDNSVPRFKEFEGKLGKSAADLLAGLKLDEEVSIKFGRLRVYAMMASDLDTGNGDNKALKDRASQLGSKIGAASSFMKPEILAIPEEKLEQFMKDEEGLAIYEQLFDNMFRTKAYTLPKEQEALLALSGPAIQASYDTFGVFKNAEIKYPVVKNPKTGEDFAISSGKYYAAMYDFDRRLRKRVYKGFYKPFINFKSTFGSLLNGNLKSIIFESKARKYKSTLEAALTPNNIPISIYNNLIDAINDNLEPLHRWAQIKKKYAPRDVVDCPHCEGKVPVRGVEKLHPYDTYVSLFPGVSKNYEYDEGKEIVLESLKLLGEEYVKHLNTAFDNRWIDVYETPGKRSGAYSTGTVFGAHPYVLLNWNFKLNDVFTLTHEMGHNMHSYLTGLNQPFVYADYSIFVAEVASTTNEALLLDYLIENAETKEEKMALIEQNLNNIQTTFYRQTRFAEFEKLVHQRTEAGESLTPQQLTDLFAELYQKYWGDAMVVDKEEGYSWARIPHFYYNFYVYQYATSFAASQALAAKIKEEGQPAIDKYLDFLKAGESQYPIDILKLAGVDMNSPEPILAVAKKATMLLDQLEALLEEEE